MNPEHKRIVELASGWEDSDAEISVSPADALLLKAVGCPLKRGKRDVDPATVNGRDLCKAAELLKAKYVKTPDGAQPTPNQQSVGPGTNPEPNRPLGPTETEDTDVEDDDDGLDDMTVAELREVADEEGVDLTASGKKADIVEAIRKARSAE